MRNAPVTTATLAALCLTTGLSTTLISLATTTTTTTAASSSLLLTHFLQQVLSVAPFSPLIIERNYWNFVSLAVVLYHLRKLERVMGSSSYFALWVVGSALGMLQGSLAAPGSNWISRSAYALPWTDPVTVLAVKYVFCLTTSCSSADRLKQHGFLYFWLLQLWVWPAVPSTYFAAAAGRFPVETISATWRVVAFASAVALGVLACTAKPNSRFQKLTLLIRRAVAEPVLQRVAVDPAHVALLRELGINAREEIEEELTCVVCLELLSPPCVELQPCRHVFCKECVRTLSTCPVCRATITARHDPNHLLRKLIDQARQRRSSVSSNTSSSSPAAGASRPPVVVAATTTTMGSQSPANTTFTNSSTDLTPGPQLVQRETPQYNRRPANAAPVNNHNNNNGGNHPHHPQQQQQQHHHMHHDHHAMHHCHDLRRPVVGGAMNNYKRKLFVSNLPFDCSSQALREAFMQIGHVERAEIIVGRSGKSRGMGIVVMTSPNDARIAIQEFDGIDVAGRAMNVRFHNKN